jgi:hypothetical protein
MAGNDIVQMEGEKLSRNKETEVLNTKRQIRVFIGLAWYYRRFITLFAEIAAPLSDLTAKGLPNNIRWRDEQEMFV